MLTPDGFKMRYYLGKILEGDMEQGCDALWDNVDTEKGEETGKAFLWGSIQGDEPYIIVYQPPGIADCISDDTWVVIRLDKLLDAYIANADAHRRAFPDETYGLGDVIAVIESRLAALKQMRDARDG